MVSQNGPAFLERIFKATSASRVMRSIPAW
jgi:hypothetical protein